jgi:hypothetical protein
LFDALQACADRFDFDALLRLLPRPDEDDEEEEQDHE